METEGERERRVHLKVLRTHVKKILLSSFNFFLHCIYLLVQFFGIIS